MACTATIWIFVLTLFSTLRNLSVSAASYCYYSYNYRDYYCYYDAGSTAGAVVGSIIVVIIIVVVVIVICVKKHHHRGVVIQPSMNVTSVNTVTTAHHAQPGYGYGPPPPGYGPPQPGYNPYGPPPGSNPAYPPPAPHY